MACGGFDRLEIDARWTPLAPARRGGWAAVMLSVGVLLGMWITPPATAQSERPGDDPATWLNEASVQARRISGVGDALTEALQTKGALLAHIAAVQHAWGDTSSATRNETLVGLCVRALAHDGEDGWVRAAQARALREHGRADEAVAVLRQIQNIDEQAAGWAWVHGETPGIPATQGVRQRFAAQLARFETHQAIRRDAAEVARLGSVRDVQAWVGVLNDPAERAWASLGAAEGLNQAPPKTTPTVEPLPEAQTQDAIPSADEPKPDAPSEPVDPSEVAVDEDNSTHPQNLIDDTMAAPALAPAPAAPETAPETVLETAPETSAAAEASAIVEIEVDSATTDPAGVEVAVVDQAESITQVQERLAPSVAETIETTPMIETVEPAATGVPEAVVAAPVDQAPAAIDPPVLAQSDTASVVVEPVAKPVAELAAVTIPVVPNLAKLSDPAAVLDAPATADEIDLDFTTTKGVFTVRVHRQWAPLAAERFHALATAGYYHNQRFFRVVPGFVVQWGIHGYPEVAAAWRSKTLADEPRTQPNRRGTIAFAAATQPNTRTTQVFINLTDNAFLDDLGFAPFGEIIRGMDVVESLFGGYGETPSARQRDIQLKGNAFLDADYPNLDSVVSVQFAPAK